LPAFYFTQNLSHVDIVTKITAAIEPSLDAMGYALVLVKLTDGRRKTLAIMADRKDGEAISVEDCTDISRTVSALLDVEDPIQSAYDLEVSSPGIDRPLTKLVDFARYAGNEVKAETMVPIDGRKRFRGIVKGVKGEIITMVIDKNEVEIPFRNIRAAKLVLTDALLAAAMKKKG